MADREQNKAIAIRLFTGVFDRHDLAVVDELVSDDFVFHNAGTELHGPGGYKTFAEEWLTGFTDTEASVAFAMAEDDLVLLHWRASGTHTGPFRGTPPTGRRVSASGLTLVRVAGEAVEEMWDETEAFGQLEALTVT